jgi:3-oxoacyl-[acyl-carrier-protein] synthase-3
VIFINAISSYLPEKCVSNLDILEDYKTYSKEIDSKITTESIFNHCGISKRYRSHPDETAKDLGVSASKKLFENQEINTSDIDYIIFVSDALEYKGPTTACIIQNNLELSTNIQAIDILHGCTGWIYGISLAKAVLNSNQAQTVLLITADVPSKVIHPNDIDLAAIFSDAGAASLISRKKIKNGFNLLIHDFIFGTDGKGEKDLYVERSATKMPATINWLNEFKQLPNGLLTGGRLYMNSAKIFLFAFRIVPKLIRDILEKHEKNIEDIDYFVLHQANGVMLEFLRHKMKIPKEKFIINIKEIGNTVSASIPIALEELILKHEIKKDSTILVAGFGIGYSWGGTLLTT